MRSRADNKYGMTHWLTGRVKCTNFIRKALSPISYINTEVGAFYDKNGF